MLTHSVYKSMCRALAVAAIVCSVFASAVHAVPGAPDATFAGGLIVTHMGGNYSQAYAVAIQPDGKIIAAGYAATSPFSFALARYNTDGSLDTSFNTTGKAFASFGPGNSVGEAVAIQPDGKIVVAGTYNNGRDFAISRHNPNGTLDTSFNGTGKVMTVFASFNNVPYAVAIQPDGKIVVAGHSSYDLAIVRYNPDGSLDTSFNNTGIVVNETLATGCAIAIQPDGKIVVAGGTSSSTSVMLARYHPNGTLDFATSAPGITVGYAVALQPDGKIVVAGGGGSSNNKDFALVRYHSDGGLDASFNGTGVVSTPISGRNDEIFGVAIQPNGKIIAAGYGYNAQNFKRIIMVRYNSNGSIDSSFNGGNAVTASGDNARGVALQPDGRIVIAGDVGTSGFTTARFVVARFLGDTKPNLTANFDADSMSDISLWNPADHHWYFYSSVNTSLVIRESWGDGSLGDRLAPGDYDGDGRADFAVYRPSEGNWYILRSSNGAPIYRTWGNAADITVPGDYDLDGKTDVAVYRPSTGNWYISKSRDNSVAVYSWGMTGDKPVPSDYDGDGATDVAVYRPTDGHWYILQSRDRFITGIHWGISTDQPVPADYDGDGRVDVAVFRPSENHWYIRLWTGSFVFENFGASGDLPVPADYDGDGRADVAIYRPSNLNWYIIQSATNTIRIANLQHDGVPVAYAHLPQ